MKTIRGCLFGVGSRTPAMRGISPDDLQDRMEIQLEIISIASIAFGNDVNETTLFIDKSMVFFKFKPSF